MQKLAYVSNSRDFGEQKNVNDNGYMKRVNEMLEQGWRVSAMTPNVIGMKREGDHKTNAETFAIYVLLEKEENNGK